MSLLEGMAKLEADSSRQVDSLVLSKVYRLADEHARLTMFYKSCKHMHTYYFILSSFFVEKKLIMMFL